MLPNTAVGSLQRFRSLFQIVGFAAIFATWTFAAQGRRLEIYSSDSFERSVNSLLPGDTLIVHEGTYFVHGTSGIRVRGTRTAPIAIQGAPEEVRPLITRAPGTGDQVTIKIDGSTHLKLAHLEITSESGDGVRLLNQPSHITLEDLEIHEVDVGINFRSSMDRIVVRRNHIYRTGAQGLTGEGMYVGCNYAECVVSNSVIEGNWIHDTKRASQGDGIEIKRGSHSNVVRDNVIHDTNYPCIILYGTEGKERNLVEGNAMWNCGEAGIQAAADVVIRNNVIWAELGIGFRSQEHQEVLPANLEFVHNTVVGVPPCVKLSEWDVSVGLVFANNAVYCEGNPLHIVGGRTRGATFSGNIFYPWSQERSIEGISPGNSALLDFLDVFDKNVYPSENSLLIAAGDPLFITLADFNGYTRSEVPDVGAYSWRGKKNPGWKVKPGFKEMLSKVPRDP
jgi:hypothetical protein